MVTLPPETVRACLVAAYEKLAHLTEPVCAKCRAPRTCCSGEYCDMAMEIASREWGLTLTPTGHPTLPMMGPEGCIAPPHVRPLCTRHLCSINGLGFDPDPFVNDAYFDLLEEITVLEEMQTGAIPG